MLELRVVAPVVTSNVLPVVGLLLTVELSIFSVPSEMIAEKGSLPCCR